MQVGKVLLFQPCYGPVDPGSAKAFWNGPLKKDSKLHGRLLFSCHGGSLLAATFNAFLAGALNLQEQGEDITHIAMLHSDVAPEEGWLDILMEDMKATGADLVAALIPIKDSRGLTSTAVEDPSSDFTVERRITLSEAQSLAPVFGAEHCGYPDRLLLANTGCWLMDFTKPWRHETDANSDLKLFFTINDRVRRDQKTNRWQHEVEPEDWFFSRRLGRLGGKVMVTQRVKLVHVGGLTFNNTQDWGEYKHDHEHAHKFQGVPIGRIKSDLDTVPAGSVPGGCRDRRSESLTPAPTSFVFPAEVRGWLTEKEGQALATLAEGKHVLEIGSYCGRSTICLGQTAQRVVSVDHHLGDKGSGFGDTWDEFNRNLVRRGVHEKVHPLRKTVEDGLRWMDRNNFDLIFIDGSHDQASVERDIELSLPLLKDGGVMAFHDANYASVRDATACFGMDEAMSGGRIDNLAYYYISKNEEPTNGQFRARAASAAIQAAEPVAV